MAGDDFKTAAPDKQYLRVYPLGMKEFDIFVGGTEEPADGVSPDLPETGQEQYFVIHKDGTGEIIAADPTDMASEFQGNISDLSVNALEKRFEALQTHFFEHAHLISPPYEGTSASGIMPERMLDSLSNFQSEIDSLRRDAGGLESSMIVLDDNTRRMVDSNREEAVALEGIVKTAEEIAPLVDDSYHLINALEGDSDYTLTGEQYDQLHETVFGVEPSQEHPIPDYAKG